MTVFSRDIETYGHHRSAIAQVTAAPDLVFARLDDPARLGGHMEKPSIMMMGGSMTYQFDDAKGRAIGSVIKMGGGFLGIELAVEEVVTVHQPPRLKVWETRGQPHILIMGAYRMGFEISPTNGGGSHLRVFIDYDHLTTLIGGILSTLFASIYADWCVRQMAKDAKRHFLTK